MTKQLAEKDPHFKLRTRDIELADALENGDHNNQ